MHRPAWAGLAAIAVAIALVATLDLLSATEFTLVRRTISQHGRGPYGWVFAFAMVLLACGSAAITGSLVRQRLVGPYSLGMLALLGWIAGLLVVGLVPKTDWSVGPSLGGYVHRVAGIVAFLCLPAAALLISVPWLRHPGRRWPARAVASLGTLCLMWITGIGVVIVRAADAGLPWWRAMPFGTVQRVLALCEIVTVVALGLWASRRAVRRVETAGEGAEVNGPPPSGGRLLV